MNVSATRRPAWVDVTMAVTAGATVGLAIAGFSLLPAIVFVCGTGVTLVEELRRAGQRRQVLDTRSVGARGGRFVLLFAFLFVLWQFAPETSWLPWYALGVGVITTAGVLTWLRWEDGYHVRRLAAGDYDRHDLV